MKIFSYLKSFFKKKNSLCQCEGCKLSRDPRSGYQPCHNIKYSGNPPEGD